MTSPYSPSSASASAKELNDVYERRMKEQAAMQYEQATVSADPWKHRSDGMRCKTCMWFAPKPPAAKLGVDLGRCRRHAPTMGGYPVVFVNDWCGDHKLNENAL